MVHANQSVNISCSLNVANGTYELISDKLFHGRPIYRQIIDEEHSMKEKSLWLW